MRAYSMDLRERVWADCRAGMKTPAVAQKYSVSASWVRRLKQRHKATGSPARKPLSTGQSSWPRARPASANWCAATRTRRSPSCARGWALRSAPARCATTCGGSSCRSKKVIQAAEQDRPDVEAKRAAWAEKVPGLDPAKLVFLDETGANTEMTRRYSRAPRGQRVVGRVPHGHGKTTMFVAALRADSLVASMAAVTSRGVVAGDGGKPLGRHAGTAEERAQRGPGLRAEGITRSFPRRVVLWCAGR